MPETDNPHLQSYRLHRRIDYRISKVARILKSRTQAGLDIHGISRMQWAALTGIELEKKHSPSDLAKHIGVSRPAISRLLKQMESDNLIERRLLGEDGRTRQLNLTELGFEKMEKCWPHVHATEQYFLGKISPTEVEVLCTAIDRLLEGENVDFDKI